MELNWCNYDPITFNGMMRIFFCAFRLFFTIKKLPVNVFSNFFLFYDFSCQCHSTPADEDYNNEGNHFCMYHSSDRLNVHQSFNIKQK